MKKSFLIFFLIPVLVHSQINGATGTVTGTTAVGAGQTFTVNTGTPTGLTIFCTNCTATDASTGVIQTYNGTTWKNNW